MTTDNTETCCPRFDPAPWDGKVITWQDKRFVRDRVTSLFHIPLNYGAVMTRNDNAIRAGGARTETRLILTDENSLWGADVYFEVSKDLPGAKMATLSGTFLSRVFEGPYRNMRNWIDEMRAYVTAQGKHAHKFYFYYTTCPSCAKKYGKNYVVILAEVA
ncbi:MAG TPA: hydrolase [Gallionella sp.]